MPWRTLGTPPHVLMTKAFSYPRGQAPSKDPTSIRCFAHLCPLSPGAPLISNWRPWCACLAPTEGTEKNPGKTARKTCPSPALCKNVGHPHDDWQHAQGQYWQLQASVDAGFGLCVLLGIWTPSGEV